MIDGQTRRAHIYISMQQPGLLCAVNVSPTESLGVQGQRVRPQPDSFWSYYPGDVGILHKKTTSWRPQTSRITRDNKDYMTALARGISREEKQPAAYETNEIFSSRWHQRSSNNTLRPSTGKSNTIGNRPPTSSIDRKVSTASLPETSRPTTAPVAIDKRSRRISAARVKPIAAPRASVPAVPYRIPRLAETSGNFENLSDLAFQPRPGSVKPSVLKSDSHFVHQLCLNTNENSLEQLNTSRDSFLDTSNRSPSSEITVVKQDSFERTESDQEENRIDSLPSFQQTVIDEQQVEVVDELPNIQSPNDNVQENDQPPTEREDDEDILEREKNIDEYSFDVTPDASADVYDYPSPFSDEYDQVIAAQSQYQSNNVNIEPNLRDLYRDTKIKPDSNPNIKAVFEKCIKLARLQTNTIRGEQRRRQNLITYNRLMKSTAFDASSTNLSGNFSSKTNNTTDKDIRELNELKRELRCNECKRITCLGNCAPGQNYHLYKRVVSSIPSQTLSSSRQLSAASGSLNNRDQQRCKHGYVSCPISSCRSGSDLINSNAMLASLSNNSTNRVRSSRTTFTYGQKNQRASVDLRPRSVRQTSREVKMKFEQVNLTPVVVVPLFEDESRSILAKHSQSRATNGLLPGKSFRSQRRDSLTIISPQKMTS